KCFGNLTVVNSGRHHITAFLSNGNGVRVAYHNIILVIPFITGSPTGRDNFAAPLGKYHFVIVCAKGYQGIVQGRNNNFIGPKVTTVFLYYELIGAWNGNR